MVVELLSANLNQSDPGDPGQVMCRATVEIYPPSDVQDVFEQIWRLGDARLFRTRHFDEYGRIRVVDEPSPQVPRSIVNFNDQLHKDSDALIRTIALLRWRCGAEGPSWPFYGHLFRWSYSLESDQWHEMPRPTKLLSGGSTPAAGHLPVNPHVQQDIEHLFRQDKTEPLAHELFREAWYQKQDNPKSALMLAITAAVIGVMDCIGQLAPRATWLLQEAPSPPIVNILCKYLPSLASPVSNSVITSPPKPILGPLEDGIRARNRIAHRPVQDKKTEKQLQPRELHDLLLVVRDLLWMLDYYAGQAWAVQHVRPELREAWHKTAA